MPKAFIIPAFDDAKMPQFKASSSIIQTNCYCSISCFVLFFNVSRIPVDFRVAIQYSMHSGE